MQEEATYLTDNELDDLTRRFKAKENPSALISEYNLDVAPNQLYKYLPPDVLEEKCRYCDSKLKRRVGSQNSSRPSMFRNPTYCSNCGHINNGYCKCKNCRNPRMDEKEMEEPSEKEKISFEELTLADKIALGALLREGISEDFCSIKPIRRFNNSLAPTDECCSKIISRLIHINAIAFHPKTNPKFINITGDENGKYYNYPSKVKWSLNVESGKLSKAELIELLMNPKILDNSQYDEALQIWKIIGYYESVEYFRFRIKKFFGIDYEIGYKTKTLLKDLINKYSISQIYRIIDKAVMKAVLLYARGGISRKPAINTISGYVESFGEKAKIKNRNLKKHKRVKAYPESALSKFFFERILKIGYDGFLEVPHIDKIKK